ncbi:transposase [Azonexus hydrophilus]|uniref:transposase n=1 Tax=Azonexus hydrophilus TaxID=418702 RepID=UPI0009DD3A97|nr:transposase [Azonexus hydrophilus]
MKHGKQALSAGSSLFCGVRWPKAKQPKRAEVLEFLSSTIPFDRLEGIVRPHFASDKRGTGRPGVSLGMLIRCYVVQRFWSLSDAGVEDMILDSHATARFIGSDPWQPRPPSASRIRQFRHLLENTMVSFDIDREISEALCNVGIEARAGRIQEPVFRRGTQ